MIELYDAAQLTPRHDWSLYGAVGLLTLGSAVVIGHAVWLQHELARLERDGGVARAALARLPQPIAALPDSLLADLERQAEQLESQAGGLHVGQAAGLDLRASQWLDRLDALSSADIGLSQVEIDRVGAARVDGVARNPKALAAYVQSWERLEALAPVRPRSIEARQMPSPAASANSSAQASEPAAAREDGLLHFALLARAGGAGLVNRPGAPSATEMRRP